MKKSPAQVTRRCNGFDAYDGCKYIDSNRLPADRVIAAGPETESEVTLQGYLAHEKTPPPPGTPKDPRHRPTVGSEGVAFSYK